MSTHFLTEEEIRNWRRSPEKITLEEFAKRLGKALEERKETNDLHDIMKQKQSFEFVEQQIQVVPSQEIFRKKLTPKEEKVFKYFIEHKGKTVFAKELAKLLNIPNDHAYKYIKNLREKLITDVLVNAEKGGYVLNI